MSSLSGLYSTLIPFFLFSHWDMWSFCMKSIFFVLKYYAVDARFQWRGVETKIALHFGQNATSFILSSFTRKLYARIEHLAFNYQTHTHTHSWAAINCTTAPTDHRFHAFNGNRTEQVTQYSDIYTDSMRLCTCVCGLFLTQTQAQQALVKLRYIDT